MTAHSWLLLVLTLPTENATARMRAWRALKTKGCAVIRDGVYLLPQSEERKQLLLELADAIFQEGGSAHLIESSSRDEAQDETFRALFDRSQEYADWVRTLTAARKSLSKLSIPELNRLFRRLQREYQLLRAIDYFPGGASVRAEAAWSDFAGLIETVVTPDEPHPAEAPIQRLDREDYQGRRWATRRHLWVDRVASAWLIRRFIDPKARFIWLDKPADCPKSAIGFDFDGATFTHVRDRVTFEVLVASFGLDRDPGLARLGELVHALDVGGAAVPEAVGFEALMTGARQRNLDDDKMLEEMSPVLESLCAFYSEASKGKKK